MVKADVPAYNCVLEVCINNRELNAAEAILTHMQERKMYDITSFNTMIKGYIQSTPPQLVTAYGLFHTMRQCNCQPDGVSYSTLIAGAVAADQMDLTWSLIDDMEMHGLHVSWERK